MDTKYSNPPTPTRTCRGPTTKNPGQSRDNLGGGEVRQAVRARDSGAVQLCQLAERDGWWCWLCGGEIDPTLPPNTSASGTVDHLVPRSRGGGNEAGNLRLAHRRCNVRRGSHLPELAWPGEWPLLMTVHVWTALARLAPRPGAAEVVAIAPLADLAADAAGWVVERAEAFVPGGWEAWTVADPAGPVAVWLRRPASSVPGSAGRPRVDV